MSYPKFDCSKLNIKPLSERIHDIDLEQVLIPVDGEIPEFEHPALPEIAKSIVEARRRYDASVIMMYGAHVIRTGNGLFMLELMKRGLVTHFATNGAASIHDFEFSLIGQTCESVAKYISEGQFGLWKESGIVNDAVRAGAAENLGWGEAVGKYIWENNFPNREKSVLAMGYHLGVPCTVHIGIGNDIINEHPNADGAAMGICSYNDFLIYAQTVTKLNHGVVMDFGTAVAGPEVYLKSLSMARNVAAARGEEILPACAAVFDMQNLVDDEQRRNFRPWRNILATTAATGGKSFYVQGLHKQTVPNLSRLTFEEDKKWKSK